MDSIRDISFAPNDDGNESPKTPILKIAVSITEGKCPEPCDFTDQFNHITLRNEDGPPPTDVATIDRITGSSGGSGESGGSGSTPDVIVYHQEKTPSPL